MVFLGLPMRMDEQRIEPRQHPHTFYLPMLILDYNWTTIAVVPRWNLYPSDAAAAAAAADDDDEFDGNCCCRRPPPPNAR